MSDGNIDNNLLLGFESFLETGIELSTDQIDRAVELSDRILDLQRQWRTYLNSLALFGFETWIEERDNFLTFNSDNCSVKHPSYASYIDGVFNLTVGKYKLCLLTNGVAVDEYVSLHRALIELPEYIAHFYVLVDVVEEQAEVRIDRFISYDEMIRHKQTAELTADADWTYEIPLVWFDSEPDDLLLYLRCLEPNTIALPARVTASDRIQEELESFLPQLQSGEPLHRVLTWSQASPLLSDRVLLDRLYELQTNQPSITDSLAASGDRLSTSISEISQTVINVKAWLSEELNELEQLSWTLFPPVKLAPSSLRGSETISRESPIEELAAIVKELRAIGEDIPEDALSGYQDFNLANHGLRLFVVIWDVAEIEDAPEWSLLLILGAQSNNYLPQGLKLQVKENDTVLDEKIVAEDDPYIYTPVDGELDDQITVSIILADGTPFTFFN